MAEYAKGKDCNKWLNGECNRKDCFFKHDPSKKGKNTTAGRPDKDIPKAVKDLLTNTAADEKLQDCQFWTRARVESAGEQVSVYRASS